MPVPTSLADWSVIESQNYPTDSDTAGGVIDDIARQIQATTRRYLAHIGTPQAGSVLSLATADGSVIEVTGSGSTITGLGTVPAGMKFTLRMAGAHTFVHSTNLVCPGGTNIITGAGDVLEWTSAGGGIWWLTDFQAGGVSVGNVPVGGVMSYAGAAAPIGWLLCGGQAISRSIYAGLFATLGTTYGVGDGSTTFNVPDLRGRTPFGLDNMGGSVASRVTSGVSGITGTTLGAAGGDQRLQSHSHGGFTGNQNATHYHVGSTDVNNVDHAHGFNGNLVATYTGAPQVSADAVNAGVTGGIAQTGGQNTTHIHSFQTSTEVGGHAHIINADGAGASQNMPPALMLNWIIRA